VLALILRCFGASSATGQASLVIAAIQLPSVSLQACGRPAVDLLDPSSFEPGLPVQPSIWLSFAPIWVLAPFLAALQLHHPERLIGLRGVIACSSSSALTKRFAANRADQHLVARLITAEDQLLATCRPLAIPCRILRPTLIYGRSGDIGDRNLSRLLALMRRLPLLPIPSPSGLRQPIHCRQLAAVAIALVRQLLEGGWDLALPERITLGGDSTLSYLAMLSALQQALPAKDSAHRCRLLPVPSPLLQLAAAPLLLSSPKAFEAVQRMSADLAGFIPCHQLLDVEPEPFPVLPLAL